jgi:hypothetical protein
LPWGRPLKSTRARSTIEGIADERDIELVLVTGAGASRNLGVREPLPLMSDWSTYLVRKLASGPMHYLAMTGLDPTLDGMEFERRLGAFLAGRLAFTQARALIEASAGLQFQNTTLNNPQLLEDYHRTVDAHLTSIVTLIQESLYELFARPEFDLELAAKSYGDLLQQLGINRSTTNWVYATTNYDPIAEMALERLGYEMDWGEKQQAIGGSAVRVAGLIDALARARPLLHLHGRVGWFRRADSAGNIETYATATQDYQPTYGTPIIMLPDPNKLYDADDVVNAIWQQFTIALQRAKRVLVLGHSLNDATLVTALAENVAPTARIAVTVLGNPSPGYTDDPIDPSDPTIRLVEANLSGARIVPIRFGDREAAQGTGLEQWTERLAAAGQL